MQPSPARQNFPKAAFSSPLTLQGGSAGNQAPGIGRAGQAAGQKAKPFSTATPTHIAFAQTSPDSRSFPGGYGGPAKSGGSPAGAFGQQLPGAAAAKAGPPPTRPGALYGALDALQAAVNAIKDGDDSAATAGSPGKDLNAGRKGAAASLTPEQVWQSIPSGGEAAWKPSNARQSQRLRVARLQEALSEAASGLQKATEACRGGGEDDVALGAAGLGQPGPTAILRQECALLEAEGKELEEERMFLEARVLEVKKEIERVQATLQNSAGRSPSGAPSMAEALSTPGSPGKNSATAGDVNELAVVLRLLACLKDLAITNRSVILASDPSKWTREQQVVAYFLDEVEACQSRIDGNY